MGDMLTLIEKAQSSFEAEEAEAMAKKLQKATFDFEDFRTQMRRMKKIGSLENILKLIPGLGGLTSKLGDLKAPEQEMARTEAVINSMTMKERRNPDLINGSRGSASPPGPARPWHRSIRSCASSPRCVR